MKNYNFTIFLFLIFIGLNANACINLKSDEIKNMYFKEVAANISNAGLLCIDSKPNPRICNSQDHANIKIIWEKFVMDVSLEITGQMINEGSTCSYYTQIATPLLNKGIIDETTPITRLKFVVNKNESTSNYISKIEPIHWVNINVNIINSSSKNGVKQLIAPVAVMFENLLRYMSIRRLYGNLSESTKEHIKTSSNPDYSWSRIENYFRKEYIK